MEHLAYVREHGLQQFLHTYNRLKDVSNDDLLWGDEIEYHIMKLDHEHKKVRLVLNGREVSLTGIPVMLFLALNALSALVWAALFVSLGYVFGLGAEHIIGDTLKGHHRLLIGLGIGVAVAIAGWLLAHHVAKKEPRE